jgi:hypothetical protein
MLDEEVLKVGAKWLMFAFPIPPTKFFGDSL